MKTNTRTWSLRHRSLRGIALAVAVVGLGSAQIGAQPAGGDSSEGSGPESGLEPRNERVVLIDLRTRPTETGGGTAGPPDEKPPSTEPVRGPGKKHFWRSAGELVLLEVLPWAADRYIGKEDYAYISFDTIKQNFKTGFQYDRDHFDINQSSHPYHGGLFFDAARTNGYGFWESGAFALTGSLLWECCMENTPPSINDLVNTTLGGMTRGEVAHRLSKMLLDNTASGGSRVFREIGAAILNPIGAFNRLVNGEMTHDEPNPEDRFPSVVVLGVDLGYRHIYGTAAHPNQAIASFSLLYGDPFEGDTGHPFDTFWVGMDLNWPGGKLISRIEERGILAGWELTERSDSVRHIFGFSQEYEYLNNESQVFGAQIFGVGLLSKYNLRPGVVAASDLSLIAFPLAGIQTTDFTTAQTGRNYDFAPGGGVRAAGRVYLKGREILGIGYGVAWAHTVNGVSDNNALQFFRAVARIPVPGPVSAGLGYSWYSRKTSYSGFFEARRTQSELRGFVNAAFAFP